MKITKQTEQQRILTLSKMLISVCIDPAEIERLKQHPFVIHTTNDTDSDEGTYSKHSLPYNNVRQPYTKY